MTIQRTYQCQGTPTVRQHRFNYLHHPSIDADPLPDHCPHCGLDWYATPPWQEVAMPHIGAPVRANVDGLYRAMEEGADHRANVAMDQFGLDKDEAAMMRMTDMKDHLHSGDTTEVPVQNAVTEVMAAAPPGVFGFQDRGQGLGYSQAAHDTPDPAQRNPGARAQQMLRRHHAAFLANSGHQGPVTSTMDALETTQPGYRRRV